MLSFHLLWLLAAAGQPEAPEIAIFGFGESPARFEQERFDVSLRTYLGPDVSISMAPAGVTTGAERCHHVVEQAREAGATYAVWYAWRWPGPVLAVHILEVEAQCAEAVSFSLRYPKVGGRNFYRVVALKLSGLLKAAAYEAPVEPEPPPEVVAQIPPTEQTPSTSLGIELAGRGALNPGERLSSASLGGALLLQWEPWSMLADFAYSFPVREAFATAEGSTSTWRATFAARHSLLDQSSDVWDLRAELSVGALGVRSSANLIDSPDKDRGDAIIPLAGVAGYIRVALGDHVAILAGPGADLLFREVHVWVRDQELYAARWVIFRADVRVQVIP